ncbi:MAG: hypothetical protein AB1486_10665 [Planctomycetota bacterium]
MRSLRCLGAPWLIGLTLVGIYLLAHYNAPWRHGRETRQPDAAVETTWLRGADRSRGSLRPGDSALTTGSGAGDDGY